DVGQPVIVVVAEVDAHAGERLAILVVADAGQQAHFAESAVAEITVQKALHGVIGDKDVCETVSIVVCKGNSQALAVRIGDSRLLRNVGKRAVSVVVVENVRQATVIIGMAVGANAIRRSFPTIAIVFEGSIHVASDKNIEPSVVVVIEEARAGTPVAASNSGFVGDIGKGSVAVVVIKNVAAVAGDVEIFETVVVVVADSHAHAVEVLRHSAKTGTFGHIGESAVRVLVVQAIPEFLAGLIRRLSVGHRIGELGAVGEEDIQPAVVVVIEGGHAAAHGFDQVFVRSGGILLDEIDMALRGDVSELHAGRGLSGRRQ